jgi:hypothetical protein
MDRRKRMPAWSWVSLTNDSIQFHYDPYNAFLMGCGAEANRPQDLTCGVKFWVPEAHGDRATTYISIAEKWQNRPGNAIPADHRFCSLVLEAYSSKVPKFRDISRPFEDPSGMVCPAIYVQDAE